MLDSGTLLIRVTAWVRFPLRGYAGLVKRHNAFLPSKSQRFNSANPHFAPIVQWLEYYLAKVGVAGSSPVWCIEARIEIASYSLVLRINVKSDLRDKPSKQT